MGTPGAVGTPGAPPLDVPYKGTFILQTIAEQEAADEAQKLAEKARREEQKARTAERPRSAAAAPGSVGAPRSGATLTPRNTPAPGSVGKPLTPAAPITPARLPGTKENA